MIIVNFVVNLFCIKLCIWRVISSSQILRSRNGGAINTNILQNLEIFCQRISTRIILICNSFICLVLFHFFQRKSALYLFLVRLILYFILAK